MFALYTADCRSTDESCPLVKFADDTALVGNISNDEDAIYHKQVEDFVNWCDKNYLYLNVSRTKEMCINHRIIEMCIHDLELLRDFLRCAIKRQL